MDATLIIIPAINWASLTNGRALTKMADQDNLKPNSPAAQVVVLESFTSGDGKSAREMIETAWGSTLSHLTFGYLIDAPPQAIESIILTMSGILTISGRDEILVSGNLLHWREGLRAGLNPKANAFTYEICSIIYASFQNMGLAPIFGKKKFLSNGNMSLE